MTLVLTGAMGLGIQRNEGLPFDPKAVSQIQFRYSCTDTTQVVITNPSQVKTIMATLKLRPKEPCACLHLREVILTVGGTQIEAGVCNHCFDLRGDYYSRWTMPDKFFSFMEAYRDSTHLYQPWDRKSGQAH